MEERVMRGGRRFGKERYGRGEGSRMKFGFRLREREAEVSYCSAAIRHGMLGATDTDTTRENRTLTYFNEAYLRPALLLPYKVKS